MMIMIKYASLLEEIASIVTLNLRWSQN